MPPSPIFSLRPMVEKRLVLSWEKSHFMVKSGIVLGYVVSASGIQVDPAKVELIEKLPIPRSVRDIRSFSWPCRLL